MVVIIMVTLVSNTAPCASAPVVRVLACHIHHLQVPTRLQTYLPVCGSRANSRLSTPVAHRALKLPSFVWVNENSK